jgi:hypothetical protein
MRVVQFSRQEKLQGMSAIGTQETSIFGLSMSAFERKADIADLHVDGCS